MRGDGEIVRLKESEIPSQSLSVKEESAAMNLYLATHCVDFEP